MDKRKIFGFGILVIVAYLWIRNKSNGIVSQDNALKEVELSNLQAKESQLQEIIEDRPQRALTNLQQITSQINNLSTQFFQNAYNKFTDYPQWERAEQFHSQQIARTQGEIGTLQKQLGVAMTEYDESIDMRNAELETQKFYNQLSLSDIRQKLNETSTNI